MHGNLSAIGSFTQTAGVIQFVGDSIQNISGITGYDVIVNNHHGIVLTGNLKITDTLKLTNGIISTDTFYTQVLNNAPGAIAGASDTSYINGKLIRKVGVGLYSLPVGSSAHYQLAKINFNSNPVKADSNSISTLTASFTSSNSGCTGVVSGNNLYVNGLPMVGLLNGGYWTIKPGSETYDSINYDVTLNQKGASNAPADSSLVAVLKRPACDSAWQNIGTYNSNTQHIAGGVVTAMRTSLPSFSDFGIGLGEGGALPVEILYLEAEAVDNAYIQVDWATVIEINNAGFILERSNNTQTWDSIGWMTGHGNSTEQIDYTFNDLNVVPEVHYYYRLKQQDFNGNYKYTEIVTAIINSAAQFSINGFIPNPTTKSSSLYIMTSGNQSVTVDVFDVIGQKVISNNYQIQIGMNKIDFDLSKMAAGNYSAIIKTGTEVYEKKLVLTK